MLNTHNAYQRRTQGGGNMGAQPPLDSMPPPEGGPYKNYFSILLLSLTKKVALKKALIKTV